MSGQVLVTGASGFVGRTVVERAAAAGWRVHAASRHAPARRWPDGVLPVSIGDLGADAQAPPRLDGIDAVVHCAARVHVMAESASDPLAAFRAVNVGGTLKLARQAADAGVRRFVFISTIGVNGAETFEQPFGAADTPAPHSPYARSKHEAEVGLRDLARQRALEVVVIRPPLVHGPDAPGNFGRLMRWLYRGAPLPFGAVRNQRSLVGLDNLCDLIVTCLRHPQAAQQTFLVSDGEDLSTPSLLRRIAAALGRPARLLPVPVALLRGSARLVGRSAFAQQLCGSLQVDMRATQQRLGWEPPISVDAALQRAAAHFLAGRARR